MSFFNTKEVGPSSSRYCRQVPKALNANFVNIWQEPLEDARLLGADKARV
jgi:hypothetical protein